MALCHAPGTPSLSAALSRLTEATGAPNWNDSWPPSAGKHP